MQTEMTQSATLDALFHDAVAVLDTGDQAALERLLSAHPQLVRERLDAPGGWLRDQVGDALDGFFQRPYLLWFVAEDPVRRGRLPANIAALAARIIEVARRERVRQLQEQLDYALRLVCWSWVARDCGVQTELMDLLLDAGASLDGTHVYEGRFGANCDAALYNGNVEAAERLLKRGAVLTLSTALCLDRWTEVERLARNATPAQMQDAFVLAALKGNAEALRRMLALGVDATTVSGRNQSHATALHHAVCSGSLEAVRVLVEAGADLSRRDTQYDGTPLGWAEYAVQQQSDAARAAAWAEIAAYLRQQVNTRRSP